MKLGYSGKKILSLMKVKKEGDAKGKGQKSLRPKTQVVAITSGKGGVGKTNIVANLGFSISQLGKRVLIFDADLGLGNLDIMLGITPRYNLSHVIAGKKRMADITLDGPGNLKILPAASGIQELTELKEEQRGRILDEFNLLTHSIDVLLIDTASGISSNVVYFSNAADEIVVVVSPEPTSITDAYALMKVLSLRYSRRKFKLLINLVRDPEESYEVFSQLSVVTDRFLDISVDYLGYILFDQNITKCIKLQKVVTEVFPYTKASRCFSLLANKICSPDF